MKGSTRHRYTQLSKSPKNKNDSLLLLDINFKQLQKYDVRCLYIYIYIYIYLAATFRGFRCKRDPKGDPKRLQIPFKGEYNRLFIAIRPRDSSRKC